MLAFISLYSLSPYKHGTQPAGRNILRCEKTSTHHDLIRGCCWKNSWLKRCGRPVSSKCAASERKKIINGQVATGYKQQKTGSQKGISSSSTEIWVALEINSLFTAMNVIKQVCRWFSPADKRQLLVCFFSQTTRACAEFKSAQYIFFVCKCNMPWKYSRTRGWRVAWLRCSRPAGLVKSITEEKGNPWWWHASSHLLRYLLNERKSSNLW